MTSLETELPAATLDALLLAGCGVDASALIAGFDGDPPPNNFLNASLLSFFESTRSRNKDLTFSARLPASTGSFPQRTVGTIRIGLTSLTNICSSENDECSEYGTCTSSNADVSVGHPATFSTTLFCTWYPLLPLFFESSQLHPVGINAMTSV